MPCLVRILLSMIMGTFVSKTLLEKSLYGLLIPHSHQRLNQFNWLTFEQARDQRP